MLRLEKWLLLKAHQQRMQELSKYWLHLLAEDDQDLNPRH